MSQSALGDCVLPAKAQVRNLACYAALWCLIYLTAPVSYIGVTHANLLRDLGNSNTVANLPMAAYQWLQGAAILVAWFLPHPRWIKPLLIGSLVAKTAVTVLVVAAIGMEFSAATITSSVIVFAGVYGAANSVQLTTLWEIVRRGVASERRGPLMGWTFGLGPVLACVGSIVQQILLSTDPITGYTLELAFPWNYLALFACSIPALLGSIVLSAFFVIPPPDDELIPKASVSYILGGLRQFVTTRNVILCAVAYLLVYSGGRAIMDNVSLHTRVVLGPDAPDTVGVQNFLRFGFKAIAGGLLGYLLAKTNPKATLTATNLLLLTGVIWALTATGNWYLLAIGWLGAGELFGAYYFSYLTSASAKTQVRVNIAYVNLLTMLVGFTAVFYGRIADYYQDRTASFYVALGILVVTIFLVELVLPARPIPPDASETDASSA